jgi:hypothetical protein
MKTIFSLMFVLTSGLAFADDVRLDPAYLDNGVYTQQPDDFDYSDALYYEGFDGPGFIQVFEPAGTAPCTHNTPVGVYCYCNNGIRIGHPKPGWELEDLNRSHYVRPGWHVRNIKGMHGGGKLCIRDRAPTPEERAEYRARHR